jgi:hypothetical protein
MLIIKQSTNNSVCEIFGQLVYLFEPLISLKMVIQKQCVVGMDDRQTMHLTLRGYPDL